MPVIEVRTRISTSAEEAFDHVLDLGAQIRAMAGSRDRLLSALPDGGILRLGDDVTWQTHHARIGFTVTSQIVEHDWPHRFVDMQLAGPFRAFRHEHLFIPIDDDVEMIDLVQYQIKAGPLGWLMDKVLIGTYLKKLLEARAAHLKQVLEDHRIPSRGYAVFDERDIA